jgi:hypothetical protein
MMGVANTSDVMRTQEVGMNKNSETWQNLQRFANEHKLILEDEGQIGFGRPCVGFVKVGSYIAYNPLGGEILTLPQTDFGDLYGSWLARWQAELDRRQGCSEVDTHTEVDKIRELGLNFFTD